MARRGWPVTAGAVLSVLACAAILAASAYADNYFNRGSSWGPDLKPIAHSDVNPMGVNVFLEQEVTEHDIRQTLDMVRNAGIGWIRQQFLWWDIEPQKGVYWDSQHNVDSWQKYDRIVELAQEYQLAIIARLDRPPNWARAQGKINSSPDSMGPPDNFEDYGNFVYQVVKRYKGKVKYFQIWNEPNLGSNWNDKPVDPAGYTRLLQVAYTRAKEANPDAVILAAGLAPTDQTGPQNLNDLTYLQKMYDAGAKSYFDIMSAMVYGLGYPPEDRRLDFNRAGFSRPILTHEVMVKNGDAGKSIWATEYAWISLPDDWNGVPSIWGKSVDAQQQGEYLVRGYERARDEWPWMGVMAVWTFRWVRPPERTFPDPTPYFSIVNHDFSIRPAYTALKNYATEAGYIGTGYYPGSSTSINYNSLGWSTAGINKLPVKLNRHTSADIKITFKGNRLDLVVGKGTNTSMTATVDGKPISGMRDDGNGGLAARPLSMGVADTGGRRITLASGLPDADHTALIKFAAPPGTKSPLTTILGAYVIRTEPFAWLYYLLYGASLAGMAAGLAVLHRKLAIGFTAVTKSVVARLYVLKNPRIALAQVASSVAVAVRQEAGTDAAVRRWSSRVAVPGAGFVLGMYYFIPDVRVTVLAAVLFVGFAALWPDIALAFTAAAAAFLYHPKLINSAQLSLAEFAILACAAGAIVRSATGMLLGGVIPVRERYARAGARRFAWLWSSPFTLPAVLFVVAASLSVLAAHGDQHPVDRAVAFRAAIREYRQVIVEPIILYILVLRFVKSKAAILRIVNAWMVVAIVAGLLGVMQYFTSEFTITAEGVSRVIAIYQHPNSLALYLGRIIPVVGCLALFLPGRRRWLYVLAMLPLLAGLFLSYSKGAWVGVFVAFLVVGVIARARHILIPAAATALAAAVILPLTHLERLTSLATLGRRTLVWRSALNMIRDHPIFGVGPDQFLYHYQAGYMLPEAQDEGWTSHAHNLILDFWTRLGILGLAAGVWVLVVYYARALAAWAAANDATSRAIMLGLIASVTDFAVHGLNDNSYFVPDLALLFWLTVGLVEALARTIDRSRQEFVHLDTAEPAPGEDDSIR